MAHPLTEIRSGGVYAARAKAPGKYALGHIFSGGRAGRPRGWKISDGSADDQMKFSFFAVFPPGNPAGILGKTVGDEPPMTACGGNFIGGEISRKPANKKSSPESKKIIG